MCEQFVLLFSSYSTRSSQARVIVTSGLLIQEQDIVLILIISYGGFRYIYIDYTYNYVLTDNPMTATTTRYLRFKVHIKNKAQGMLAKFAERWSSETVVAGHSSFYTSMIWTKHSLQSIQLLFFLRCVIVLVGSLSLLHLII